MNLFIDIETIPSQKPDAKDGIVIEAPGNYKKPESITKWLDENSESEADKVYQKFGLDGALGEIICIGYAFDDEEPKIIGRQTDASEATMLIDFFKMLYDKKFAKQGQPESFTWVGHYITGFDLRFIWQRCVANNVKPLVNIPYKAKPWDNDVFDTMSEWTGIKKTGIGKLDAICKALGHEGKGDIDGSQVWEYIKAGRYDEIFNYCKDDVELTRFLYRKMTFNL